jgi:hypothetical protein
LDNSFWMNVYGQVHNWLTTFGLFIVLGLAQYVLDNETWTWRGLVIALAGALIKYAATRDDHVKTGQAVQKAAATGEVPGKEQS